ncbi:MAG TPA: oxygenase MpaB family protein [Thermoleophilaceae bacterium]|nr:oxygenase MpaB family protein [Thermoleophilaceae bacterium]
MSDAGLFGPGSLTWRVNREGVLLVGGGAALTLQVAHPLVAAGVAKHSNYREDPWGRLYRTLDLTTKIVFGSTEVAGEASARIKHVHGRVKGVTTEDGGRFPAGTKYDARDPELLMWVHATLVKTSLDVYTRYVGSLSASERHGYYEEQKLLGEQFGVPRDRQPADYDAFEEYFADMLASDRIAVTDALRDVVDATLRPDLPFFLRPMVEALNLATVGLLPDRLRAELGLKWTPNRRRVFDASRAVLSAALPVLPRVMREFPPARSADRRVRRLAAA